MLILIHDNGILVPFWIQIQAYGRMLKLGGYSTLWFWDRWFKSKSLENSMCSVPQSVQLANRIFSCLGTNMKNYAACEHRIEHWHHTMLHEYLFDSAANALLTVPRAVGNLAGNTTSLQLETEVKGRSSTHGKSFDNNEIDTWKNWWGSWVISLFILGTRPTKEI